MIWLVAYLYFMGMLATAFAFVEANNPRPYRVVSALVLWPVTVPFVIIYAFVRDFA